MISIKDNILVNAYKTDVYSEYCLRSAVKQRLSMSIGGMTGVCSCVVSRMNISQDISV